MQVSRSLDKQTSAASGSPKVGLSFVVCCHNSAQRIAKVLHCLASQEFAGITDWEILVVDNASTDGTAEAATVAWADEEWDARQLRIVVEESLGIAYARYTGIRQAAYEFICFIDDDNWVAPDYAQTAFTFMAAHDDVAACGSLNDVAADVEVPGWFETFRRSFAVGPQSEQAGDVTMVRGVLWSAGMVLRRSTVLDMLAAGFEPMVTGAQGTRKLLRSEDYELCLALRLRGWRLWYLPELKLQHYMFAERLTWDYLKRLMAGVGASDPGLFPYYVSGQLRTLSSRMIWLRYVVLHVLQLVKHPVVVLTHRFVPFEGQEHVLQVVRAKACLRSLVVERSAFLKALDQLRVAGWMTGTLSRAKQSCGS